MDKVKKFIRDNIVLLVVLLIILIVAIIVYIITGKSVEYSYNITDEAINTPSYIEKKYDANTYQNQTIELLDLLTYYYKYYINLEINNPTEAYNLLSDESKNKFNNNVDEYIEYVESIKTINTKDNTIAKYRETEDSVYDIIDSENYRYTIEENAVWDFKVTIKGQQ